MKSKHDKHVQRLAEYLIGVGALNPDDDEGRLWLQALREVPRHRFVPVRAHVELLDKRPRRLLDRLSDPDGWWEAVYSNVGIVPDSGGGRADLAGLHLPRGSSALSPHLVFEFLQLMHLRSHHRVLEVGTGWGWTAAMLAWRLGSDRVTTIEVDAIVAAAAADNLVGAGLEPMLLVGDGALGCPDRAPFDRVYVTCGVREVSYALIRQTRPGGCIVLPYVPPHGQGSHLLRLHVRDDGTAVGTVHGGCGVPLMLRSQRRDSWPPYGDQGVKSTTRVDPRDMREALGKGFGLALASAAPHIVITTAGWEGDDGWHGYVVRLRDLTGDGWALVTARPEERTEVAQGGSRRLWTALEAVYMSWLRAGRPGPDAYKVIVTSEGQDVQQS